MSYQQMLIQDATILSVEDHTKRLQVAGIPCVFDVERRDDITTYSLIVKPVDTANLGIEVLASPTRQPAVTELSEIVKKAFLAGAEITIQGGYFNNPGCKPFVRAHQIIYDGLTLNCLYTHRQ